jgi:uncharacterized protein HemX
MAEIKREREQGYPHQPDPATQPAPMLEDEERSILLKHVVDASREIEERKQLTANQREAEALTSEIGRIAAQLAEAQKFPSKYKAEIESLTAQLEGKQAQVDRLTQPATKDWRTSQNNTFEVVGGKIYQYGK